MSDWAGHPREASAGRARDPAKPRRQVAPQPDACAPRMIGTGQMEEAISKKSVLDTGQTVSFDRWLCQHRLHDHAMDVREAEIPALEAVGQLFVIHAHQVHDSGVQVVHVDGFPGDVVAEVVGLA